MKRPWDAILWWELRRIPFNLAVGVAGLLSVAVVVWLASMYDEPPYGGFEPFGIFTGSMLYGLAANAAYTLGWLTELLWFPAETDEIKARRTRVFRAGLIFSLGLTLLPAAVAPVLWMVFG